MRITHDYYLIIDVEATCSDVGEVPRREMEIIEIGAVMQSFRTFEIESDFQIFVRPVRYPELTGFCTELTGITHNDVASTPLFAEALDAMKDWMDGFGDALFCSWGDYDRNQFIQDCDYHRIPYPFRSKHLNLKAEFSRTMGLKKKLGVKEVLKHIGLNFQGSHHRGLDDAKNIARLVRKVCVGA